MTPSQAIFLADRDWFAHLKPGVYLLKNPAGELKSYDESIQGYKFWLIFLGRECTPIGINDEQDFYLKQLMGATNV